jgi:hypothetical protein
MLGSGYIAEVAGFSVQNGAFCASLSFPELKPVSPEVVQRWYNEIVSGR